MATVHGCGAAIADGPLRVNAAVPDRHSNRVLLYAIVAIGAAVPQLHALPAAAFGYRKADRGVTR